jgi:cbb3-type cytochrome oxidase maturation protein
MEIIFILIGISIVVAGLFLVSFLMNVKKGQYDDMYTPSVRILFDTKKDNKQSEDGIATDN